MSRQIVFTPKAAKPPATYSQAVKVAGLVFVSGTAPQDPATGQITGTTIQEQTRQCLTNIAAILEEAGSSLDIVMAQNEVEVRERLRHDPWYAHDILSLVWVKRWRIFIDTWEATSGA
jgi:2-iminobutanoate/2-iminopropanoate deaminase